MINIGVLSYQGSVIEHINMLKTIKNVKPIEVKYLHDLNLIDAIILPGGESTHIGKMLSQFNLLEPLRERILNGMPVWGTCAGMILLAKEIVNQTESYLNVMDITVKRNAYGSQYDSFSTKLTVEGIDKPIQGIFIRAPYIQSVNGKAKPICIHNGNIVASKQDNILATSFHPELTLDNSFHRYFVSLIK